MLFCMSGQKLRCAHINPVLCHLFVYNAVASESRHKGASSLPSQVCRLRKDEVQWFYFLCLASMFLIPFTALMLLGNT